MQKAIYVREKFSNIHLKYDLLNSILSLGIDKYWRIKTVNLLRALLNGDCYREYTILDLCAGTMPLTMEIARKFPNSRIIAADFCKEMLFYGKSRINGKFRNIFAVCADALNLPFKDSTFDAVLVAFGVRNFADIRRGLSEIHRVLKIGGIIIILEFSNPQNILFRPIYRIYLNYILPNIAGLISGDKDAYRYLASSISKFPMPEDFARIIRDCGFSNVKFKSLTQNIVCIHFGRKELVMGGGNLF